MDSTPTASPPKALQVALRKIFRPLVRFLISRAIPFPFAANLMRIAYVEVAVEEFPVAGKPQTDSRVTLLTGVHRKDVKRLRSETHERLLAPRSASLGSQLIARWTTLPEFLDAQGAPRPLPRWAGEGEGESQSFESLVRSVNTDIRPRVVLDEWLRRGMVRVDEQDRVCLNVEAFVPTEGSEEMTYYFGRNLHDHVAAAVHNMLGGAEPLFERSVHYNNLSAAAVAELRELAKRRGMQVLRELDGRALQLQQRDSDKPEASHRFNCGVYVFHEDEAQRPQEEDSDAP